MRSTPRRAASQNSWVEASICGALIGGCSLIGSVPPQDDGARRGEVAAGAVHAREARIGDLAGTALVAQRLGRLDQQEHAALSGMTRRQTAAVGIGGERATDAQLAVFDERATLARLAEPETLEGQQHG